jgi:uncharacterized protein (DUF488 family)
MAVFTIGYEGRSLEAFIADLHRAGVRILADVRDAPVSRKPGFSRNTLEAALNTAGIGYRHIHALGCPKPIRDAYTKEGDWARYTRSFMQHLAQQRQAIDELASLAHEAPTALLCYEADFNRCHRTYVARAVAKRSIGAPVRHITPEGTIDDGTGENLELL